MFANIGFGIAKKCKLRSQSQLFRFVVTEVSNVISEDKANYVFPASVNLNADSENIAVFKSDNAVGTLEETEKNTGYPSDLWYYIVDNKWPGK